MEAHYRTGRVLIVAMVVCLGSAPGHAAALEVVSLAEPPTIDGDVRESEWMGAHTAGRDFVQIEPAYGAVSPFRTLVRVGQTATALYIAIEAFDPDIAQLAAGVTQRDALSDRDTNNNVVVKDDTVSVFLDAFGDGRTAYVFRANPLATQEDARIADNGRAIDFSWDGAWRSAARRLEDRWTAEFEIPFATLLYAADKRPWRINFVRTVPRRLETSVWSGPSESVYRVSGFGDLSGIKPPAQRADVWQFIPYAIASYEVGKGARAEFGGDIRWRPSSNLGVDLTYNPDFALVDADVEVVNLTRFESFVPERRPFFLEGTEMYNQRYRQFHSRRLGDINWGAKTNGRLAGTDFSFIAASEDLRFQNGPGEKTAYYGIFRAQHSLWQGANIGILAANRNLGGQNTGSIGIDTTMFFTDELNFEGQFFRVHGPTADGGVAWYVRPSYDTATTHFHVRWGHFAPGIRNDFNTLGFLQDDNRKEVDTNLRHVFFFDTGLLERLRPAVNYNRYTGFDHGVLRGWALAPTVTAILRNRLEFEIARRDEYRLLEKGYRNEQTTITAGWNARDGRSISFNAGMGRNFGNDLLLYGTEAHWAFGDAWRLSYTLTKVELSPDIRHESTIIHVLETTYSFNPDLFVRAFFQTNSAIDKENVQVLGVWRFRPPFGSFQVAYQRGTSPFGQQSTQGDTFFTKLAWVI